jgi:hypothetical protein
MTVCIHINMYINIRKKIGKPLPHPMGVFRTPLDSASCGVSWDVDSVAICR